MLFIRKDLDAEFVQELLISMQFYVVTAGKIFKFNIFFLILPGGI